MDDAEYQKAIPEWCRWKTVQEHIDALGLCWGITSGGVQSKGIEYCRGCSEKLGEKGFLNECVR